MEEGKIILGEVADNANVEKASLIIISILEDNNFRYLVNNWRT